MAIAYLGEIRLVSFSFAPKNWAFCDGQLMSLAENLALFSLIGTTYGGDGRTTFALPDLRGRLPMHANTHHVIGEYGGEESVTLTLHEMAGHTHHANGIDANATAGPEGSLLASANALYQPPPRNNDARGVHDFGLGREPGTREQAALSRAVIRDLYCRQLSRQG